MCPTVTSSFFPYPTYSPEGEVQQLKKGSFLLWLETKGKEFTVGYGWRGKQKVLPHQGRGSVSHTFFFEMLFHKENIEQSKFFFHKIVIFINNSKPIVLGFRASVVSKPHPKALVILPHPHLYPTHSQNVAPVYLPPIFFLSNVSLFYCPNKWSCNN